MVDWFKTDKGNQSIIGKNPAIANLTVSKDGGEVDAITASTISSRAFLFSVRNAYHAFVSNKDEVVASVKDSIQIN
jgi:electron transport complex protein RnfG